MDSLCLRKYRLQQHMLKRQNKINTLSLYYWYVEKNITSISNVRTIYFKPYGLGMRLLLRKEARSFVLVETVNRCQVLQDRVRILDVKKCQRLVSIICILTLEDYVSDFRISTLKNNIYTHTYC